MWLAEAIEPISKNSSWKVLKKKKKMEEKVVENCKVVDENVSSSRCSSMGE